MKEQIIIRAISQSTGEIYKIQVTRSDGVLSIRCGCPAGIHKMLCKHRIKLIKKDISLFLAEDHSAIQEFYMWDEFKNIEEVFNQYNSSIVAFETEIKKIQKEIKIFKNNMGEILNDGIKYT